MTCQFPVNYVKKMKSAVKALFKEIFIYSKKIIQVFGLNSFFLKKIVLGSRGQLGRTFSEIGKMVFTWSISKFSH